MDSEEKTLIQFGIDFWNKQRLSESSFQRFFKRGMPITNAQYGQFKQVKKFLRDHQSTIEDFPSEIKAKMTNIIVNLGFKIIEWLMRVFQSLGRYCNNFDLTMQCYLDNVIWTETGSIDSVAIFKKIFDEKLLDEPHLMFIQACNCCLEDYISKWNERFASENEKILTLFRNSDDKFDAGFYKYWIERVIDGNKEIPPEKNKKMLRKSILMANITGVKFFLPIVMESEDSISLWKSLLPLWKSTFSCDYQKTAHRDILIFLKDQLLTSDEGEIQLRSAFLSSIETTVLSLASPWEDDIFKVVKKNFRNIVLSEYRNLLLNFLKEPEDSMNLLGICGDVVVGNLLNACPCRLKKRICEDGSFVRVLRKLNPPNISYLEKVINDKDVAKKRQQMIDQVAVYTYIQIFEKNIYFTVDQFSAIFKEEILVSDEERKAFDHNRSAVQRCGIFVDENKLRWVRDLLNKEFQDRGTRKFVRDGLIKVHGFFL